MPIMTNLTINDGINGDHTFKVFDENNGVAIFKEDAANLLAQNVISISSREVGGKVKSRIKIDMPMTVTETINGVDYVKLLGHEYAEGSVTLSMGPYSSGPELKNILANALASTQADINNVMLGKEKFR